MVRVPAPPARDLAQHRHQRADRLSVLGRPRHRQPFLGVRFGRR
jgi:hypothetical protein